MEARTETEDVVNQLAEKIKCHPSEIIFYAQHLEPFVCVTYNLPTPACKTAQTVTSNNMESGTPLTPTDSLRVSAAVAA